MTQPRLAATLSRSLPFLSILQGLGAALLVFGVLVVAPVRAQGVVEIRGGVGAASAQTSDDMRALEKQVQIVLAEARKQQEQLAVQRQRLTAAEATNAWLPWLLLALLGLAGLSAWLGLRLTRLRRPPRTLADRPAAFGPAATGPSAAPTSAQAGRPEATTAAPHALDRSFLSGLVADVPAAPAPSRPAPPSLTAAVRAGLAADLSPRDLALGTGVAPRPMTVEELLDLDQQVDFFLALGQAQSAVDLLLGHVRGTGGSSALPYFKLLEIYRQEDDADAYERTRERFNQRFNAHAPDWSGDLASGRALEDYPEVVQRLQQAWPLPMRAVAELDGLLLRRADLEPFDLPAYRELLMLHALVRDLPAAPLSPVAVPITTPAVLQHEDAEPIPLWPAGSQGVDLLLPLDEPVSDITAPRPHLSEQNSTQAMFADWVFTRSAQSRPAQEADTGAGDDRPPRPARLDLDLDLSDYAPAPREFTRPAAFTDIDMRRDRRLSDLGGLDDTDGDPGPLPRPSRR